MANKIQYTLYQRPDDEGKDQVVSKRPQITNNV